MSETPETVVVRLGHRPGRDERITTHVALVARAFGADRVVLPDAAAGAGETVEDITERFGGPFAVEMAPPLEWLRSYDGPIAHLTMYGQPIDDHIEAVSDRAFDEGLAVVVGAGKVPPETFELATWNLAVGNQPHSEIAALAICLDRLDDDPAYDRTFADASRVVVPRARDKRVIDTDEDSVEIEE